MPIETDAGVGFSAWRHVLMTDDGLNGELLCKGQTYRRQLSVLRRLKNVALETFQFNADGIVVAVWTIAPYGRPSVPGAVVHADKLPQRAVTLDIEMRRDFKATHLLKIGVFIPIQLIEKQLRHLVAAILAWG